MDKRVRITESLDIDLDRGVWLCNRCGKELISSSENYKKGCLIHERSPHEIWDPIIEGDFTFSYDPGWGRIIEFYCPACGTMFDNEVLPPGHPITHDIDVDIERLRIKHSKGKEA